ncbi:hypothetical protein ABLE68_16935 [Nocardioides sp. CN2-186]|uniref:hypothetical protein n=1 Tax=Nocardioides tweenelious TaxID=3156607 RepID=UPI0032B4FD01
MATSRGPQPERILAKAATVENLITWVIAASICRDQRGFSLFMRYAADRIPIAEKIKLVGEVVSSLPDPTVVYDGFLDDLRFINQVRVRVAHAVVLPKNHPLGQHYITFRKGKPEHITNDEMRAQVADALKRVTQVGRALRVIQSEAPLPFPPPSVAPLKATSTK